LLAARRDDTIDSVFTEWKGMATLADPARPFDIGITADRAAGFAVVYAPAGSDFVAVEPVTHMTDAFNRATRGDTDTGTRILAAGAGFSCTIRIFLQVHP
jgi:aldose 1-epimerase